MATACTQQQVGLLNKDYLLKLEACYCITWKMNSNIVA